MAEEILEAPTIIQDSSTAIEAETRLGWNTTKQSQHFSAREDSMVKPQS